MASKTERRARKCAEELERADGLRHAASLMTLADVIDQLRDDAHRTVRRIAFERRPTAGGYGNGRRRHHDGGISECHLAGSGSAFGLYEETHLLRT